jgi:transcriptional regulator with XRE-family HTH domain
MNTATLSTAGGLVVAKELPHIAARLKALRERVGLSQQELATRAGVSVAMVFQLEQGRRKDVKLTTLVALAEALGIDPGQLTAELTRPEEEKPPAKKRQRGK